MKQHTYRITVEHLADAGGEPVSREALVFAARNHDDLYSIVEKSRRRGLLNADDSAAMVIGLKLLGEIALEHRDEPPFDQLRAPLGAFIKSLKAMPAAVDER